MSFILVIEGCDCTGKTTLADSIAVELAAHGARTVIIHSTRMPTPLEIERHLLYNFGQALAVAARGDVAILDRWWISDSIYAPLFGRKCISAVARGAMNTLQRELLDRSRTIICTDTVGAIVERHRKRFEAGQEMYSDVSEVAKAYHGVVTGARKLSPDTPFSAYCWTPGLGAAIASHILEKWRLGPSLELLRASHNWVRVRNLIESASMAYHREQ